MLMNVDGRNCSTVKKSVMAHSSKCMSSISTGNELELWTAMVQGYIWWRREIV